MDEKEIDLKIEKEMVDLFIISNRKERTLWELESPRKRSDGLSRFFFGTYLNQNLFKALDVQGNAELQKVIQQSGGTSKGYVITPDQCGFFSKQLRLLAATIADLFILEMELPIIMKSGKVEKQENTFS